MSQQNLRNDAIDHAELTEDDKTIAVVYALTHLADQLTQLIDQLPTLDMLHTALPECEAEPGPSGSTTKDLLPRLTRTLQAESPFTEEPSPEIPTVAGGVRQYRPAHDPRSWTMDPETGYWISPAGRRFSPTSRQVRNVIYKLENMRRKGTLYSTPIHKLEDENS